MVLLCEARPGRAGQGRSHAKSSQSDWYSAAVGFPWVFSIPWLWLCRNPQSNGIAGAPTGLFNAQIIHICKAWYRPAWITAHVGLSMTLLLIMDCPSEIGR